MARRRDDYDDDDYDDDDDYEEPRPKAKKKGKKGRGGAGFGDFLRFRVMITPTVIMILFWVGVVGVVGAGIYSIIWGLINAPGAVPKLIASLTGLAIIILGPLALRVYAELIIVFFNVYDTLTDIKKELQSDEY